MVLLTGGVVHIQLKGEMGLFWTCMDRKKSIDKKYI